MERIRVFLCRLLRRVLINQWDSNPQVQRHTLRGHLQLRRLHVQNHLLARLEQYGGNLDILEVLVRKIHEIAEIADTLLRSSLDFSAINAVNSPAYFAHVRHLDRAVLLRL